MFTPSPITVLSFPSLSPSSYHCPLLPITVPPPHHCPLRPITVGPFLPIIVPSSPSLSPPSHYCPLLPIIIPSSPSTVPSSLECRSCQNFDRPKSAAFIIHQSIMQLSAAFIPLCQSKNAASPLMIHRLKHQSRPSIHQCHQSSHRSRSHRSIPSYKCRTSVNAVSRLIQFSQRSF